MQVRTTLTGTSPILLHNVQLADPNNYWVKLIRGITSKRIKTPEDHEEIARLEWFGSLYVQEGALVIPTSNMRTMFRDTAKLTKMGKAVERALLPTAIYAPLVYRGPKTPEALWEAGTFRDMTAVRVQQARTMRCRPIFVTWMVESDWELESDVLDLDVFKGIVVKAGRVTGLCDNRTNGYGRFTAEVQAL